MSLTFQQLQCLRQLVASGLSVSRTAEALHTTQPSVSKMLRALEDEIGLELFVRGGNRLTALTEAGQEALVLAGRVLQDTAALKRLDQGHGAAAQGTLRVGTTHIHARYSLIAVAQRFFAAYPGVNLEFTINPPAQILAGVVGGTIDIGLCTLPKAVPRGVLTLKAYEIDRCLVVPPQHPLLALAAVTVEDIARWPLITHDESFTSGVVALHEFQRRGITPRVLMRAMDANVIKAYVAAGMGVAVIQKMAVDPALDTGLRVIAVDHLFPSSSAMVSLRVDHVLRPFAFDFIRMVAPEWTREAIEVRLQAAAAGPAG
ncbi:MAG: LysR substrate-binding domain-containing protein [Pseudomonadota bacterium]